MMTFEKRRWQSMFLAGMLALTVQVQALAASGLLQGIQCDPATGTITITASDEISATVNSLNVGANKRIILDLRNAEIGPGLPRDTVLLQQLSAQWPSIKGVSVNQFGGTKPVVRILLDVAGSRNDVKLLQSAGSTLSLRIAPEAAQVRAALPASPAAEMATRPATGNAAASDLSTEEMKRTLAVMNQRYEALTEENRRLKGELQEKERSYQEAAHIKSELDRLRRANESLQNQLFTQRASAGELAALTTRIEALDAENGRLKTELASARAAAPEQQRQESQPAASTAGEQYAGIQAQLDKARSSLATSIETINRQNQEIAYLKRRMDGLKSGMESAADEQTTRLVREKETLQQQLAKKEQEITRLNTELAAARQARPLDLAATSGEVAVLKEELKILEQQYKTVVDRFNQEQLDHRQALERMKARTADPADVARLEDEKTQLASEKEALATRLAALEAGKQELVSENALLSKQLETLKTAADSLDEKQQQEQQLLISLEKRNTELEQQVQALLSEKEESAKQDNRIDVRLDALEKEKAQLARQLAEAKKTAESLESEKKILAAGLNKELQRKVEEISRLEKDLAAAEKSVSRRSGKNDDSRKLRGELVELREKYDGVLQQLDRYKDDLAALGGGDSLAALASGASALAGQVSPQAISQAEKHYELARDLETNGKPDMAIEEYQRAVQLDPDNVKYVYAASAAMAETRQFDEAMDLLERFIRNHPYEYTVYNQIGKIYLLKDQLEPARQAFARGIPVNVLNNYASTLRKLGKYDEAETAFRLALEVNPEDSDVLFNLGNLYNTQNNLAKARENYIRALDVRPDFAEAHYNLGLVYSKLEEREKAVTHLEKFLQLEPGNRKADVIRTYVEKLKTAKN